MICRSVMLSWARWSRYAPLTDAFLAPPDVQWRLLLTGRDAWGFRYGASEVCLQPQVPSVSLVAPRHFWPVGHWLSLVQCRLPR